MVLSWNQPECLLLKDYECSRQLFLSHHQSTPMHMAAERGHTDILIYLAENGAVVSVKDIVGVSMLQCYI